MPNEIWLAVVAVAVIVGLAISSMVHSSMHQKKLNLLREGVFMTGIRFVFREVGGIMTVLTTLEYQRALARKVARPTWNREFWIQGTWTFVRNPDDLRDYHTATVGTIQGRCRQCCYGNRSQLQGPQLRRSRVRRRRNYECRG